MIGLVLFWLVCGVVAASIAQSKNYSGCLWLFAGFLLGPLAVLAIGLMAAKPIDDKAVIQSGTHRACPFCAETIRAEAVKCRHCGSQVPPG